MNSTFLLFYSFKLRSQVWISVENGLFKYSINYLITCDISSGEESSMEDRLARFHVSPGLPGFARFPGLEGHKFISPGYFVLTLIK